ncbi:hypothetical protein LTR09_008988 [Extremus antarcticus]|uniref:Uncharacterized protein n=1 Tax=Extremus antarcticus TaxID=702011 RepID=A0AAJ0DA26_9PEZI|nr:hypothetical protein LTR09_008988 [Extremus antarcticus]
MKIITARRSALEDANERLRAELEATKADNEQLARKLYSTEGDLSRLEYWSEQHKKESNIEVDILSKRYLALKRECYDRASDDAFNEQDDELFGVNQDDEDNQQSNFDDDDEENQYEAEHQDDIGHNRQCCDDDQCHDRNQTCGDNAGPKDQVVVKAQDHAVNEDCARHQETPCEVAAETSHADATIEPAAEGSESAALPINTDTLSIPPPRPLCLLWPSNLATTTRLDDNEFYSAKDFVGKCYVPVETQHRLMKTALRLSQEALFDCLHTHWPHIQREHYPEGPAEIKLGNGELFGSLDVHFEKVNTDARCKRLALDRVHDIAELRNAVCHPEWCRTSEVDNHLWRAQIFAIRVLDEPRAIKIRGLRDELQAEAKQANELMGTMACLAQLNEDDWGIPWPLHLQRLFSQIAFGSPPSLAWSANALAATQVWRRTERQMDGRGYRTRAEKVARHMRPGKHVEETERLGMVSSANGIELEMNMKNRRRASICFAQCLERPKVGREKDF